MNRYAVALYLEKDNQSNKQIRLYQAVVSAIDEHQAFGLAYEEASEKLPQFALVLSITTIIKKKGCDDEG